VFTEKQRKNLVMMLKAILPSLPRAIIKIIRVQFGIMQLSMQVQLLFDEMQCHTAVIESCKLQGSKNLGFF